MSAAPTAHRLFRVPSRSGAFVDAAVTVAALAGTFAQVSHGGIVGSPAAAGELDWISGALAASSTLPIFLWRSAPRATLLLTASATMLLAALGYPLALPLGSAAALYLFVASRGKDDPAPGSGIAAVIALFVAYLGASTLGGNALPASELVHAGFAWAVAWFAGERTRLRHEHVAELAERATRNEREAERERLLAIAEERARIARDLHDSAGHAINVIAVRAGGARLRQDPERSQAALEAIEELARKTVGEIDQIVGSLRDPGAGGEAVDAPPALASLDALAARHAAAGLDVRVESEGRPRRLERAVDQAAYRILQEALTNAARHGAGPVRVELGFGETALELTITNAVAGGAGPRSNGGHGLIGMRERATLLGGSLAAEPANGSFRVQARLPYAGPSG